MMIAILGCGPAGLLAAEAVAATGNEPIILSRKVKSEIFGAQYLHREIPGITPVEPEFKISVIKNGTKEGYAYNTYGDPNAPVSWDAFQEGETVGWDMKKAYDKLWEKFESNIYNTTLHGHDLVHLSENYPIIYTTLPARMTCHRPNRHTFKAQEIWVQHGDGSHKLIRGVNDNNILYYNGETPAGSGYYTEMIGPGWYRFSQLNGYQAWEFSHEPPTEAIPDHHIISTGVKPLSNDCDCWPELRRIGRFGRWEKGILTHHAYEQVLEDLS
jgi:hypothetical protein